MHMTSSFNGCSHMIVAKTATLTLGIIHRECIPIFVIILGFSPYASRTESKTRVWNLQSSTWLQHVGMKRFLCRNIFALSHILICQITYMNVSFSKCVNCSVNIHGRNLMSFEECVGVCRHVRGCVSVQTTRKNK